MVLVKCGVEMWYDAVGSVVWCGVVMVSATVVRYGTVELLAYLGQRGGIGWYRCMEHLAGVGVLGVAHLHRDRCGRGRGGTHLHSGAQAGGRAGRQA